MKYAAALLLSAFIISCDKSVDPEEQLIFYKSVNKEIFNHDLTIEASTYQDSLYPQIKLFLESEKFSLFAESTIMVSNNLDFTNAYNDKTFPAGSYIVSNKNFYTYRCKSSNEKIVCIRMQAGDQIYFTIGIDLSKVGK